MKLRYPLNAALSRLSPTTVVAALTLMVSTNAAVASALEAQEIGNDPRVREAISLLDRWTDAEQAYQQFPGISIGVVHDQTLLWAKGFGAADLEAGRPASRETIYSICSISKLFTSVAAMRLVDQRRLSLDSSVAHILPWFAVAADEAESQLITLRRLLTHTSGLEKDIGVPPDSVPYLYWASDEELQSLLPLERLRHAPGAAYTYSNLGMALVGAAIETVSGELFEDFVTREILTPLGMSSTIPDIGQLWGSPRVAVGYGPVSRGGGRVQVEPFQGNAMIPAMGFASTVEDLAEFISWQFRVLDGGDEILNASTLRDMYEAHFVDSASATVQGLGFEIQREGSGDLVGHSGFCPGFQSDLRVDPARRLGVVALSNSMIPAWEFTERAQEIIGSAIDIALADPSGGRAMPGDFAQYVGTYEGFPWSGEWQVIPWSGSLAMLHLPVDDPLAVLRPLRHIRGAEFRTEQVDGSSGMRVRFETDTSGTITRMLTGNYPRRRIR